MRPPPTEEEYLRLLRDLKHKIEHAEDLYDRFGDERVISETQRLTEEIAKIPAHIREADALEFKLQLLTCAVEDYLVARASQFMPDVIDLWAAVQAMLERPDKPETPAEKPIISLLDELRPLAASDEQVKSAVLRAVALESYKTPLASRRYSGARRMKPARDYRLVLGQQVTAFLQKGGLKISSGSGLVGLIKRWQGEPEDPADAFMVRFYRQSILSAIAVLHTLDVGDEEINGLVLEAYGKWSAKGR